MRPRREDQIRHDVPILPACSAGHNIISKKCMPRGIPNLIDSLVGQEAIGREPHAAEYDRAMRATETASASLKIGVEAVLNGDFSERSTGKSRLTRGRKRLLAASLVTRLSSASALVAGVVTPEKDQGAAPSYGVNISWFLALDRPQRNCRPAYLLTIL